MDKTVEEAFVESVMLINEVKKEIVDLARLENPPILFIGLRLGQILTQLNDVTELLITKTAEK